jgi:16S rRNA C967 or C1407 C5-methylase (RsmB/RsmF family)/NOL1/NOP2/fmu family ribosome biogenesis protein
MTPTDLPLDFTERLRAQWPDAAETTLTALNTASTVAVNLNPHKPSERFGDAERIPWNHHGRYVAAGNTFADDPLWHAGAYYVMEPASQVISHVVHGLLEQMSIHSALDLCAAPGGKSSVIMNHLPEDAYLVSNEIIRNRAQVLYENSVKWGLNRHIVTHASPDDLAAAALGFDLVVVDAPCSGEGMFRKDHNARTEWSSENVAQCAVRQNDILDAAAQMTVQGGVLIYSTCTFAEVENDEQVERLLSTGAWELISDQFNPENGVRATRCGYQFAPGLTRSEGLFFAVLRKKGEQVSTTSHSATEKNAGQVLRGKEFREKDLPFASDGLELFTFGKQARYLPELLKAPLNALQEARVPILRAGVAMYEAKGRHWVPAHEAALWTDLITKELETIELDRDVALDYLRGQSGRDDFGKGWKLVAFEGHRLGWIKAIGNRWNNHYPQQWKLRK